MLTIGADQLVFIPLFFLPSNGADDQTKGSPSNWYWQQVSMDNGDLAPDTDMQIPERRSDMGMVYIPSYVHMLSVGDAAYAEMTVPLSAYRHHQSCLMQILDSRQAHRQREKAGAFLLAVLLG